MIDLTRRLGTMALLTALGALMVGCGSSGNPPGGQQEETKGQLALPLTTQGASGVVYRLRDATFEIARYGYMGSGGYGGGWGGPVVTVSSETDPDAATISVELEEGQYFVQLLPGWHFEKQTSSGYEQVEATLLSGESQYVWVSRLSTSFAQYQFGLGGSEIWLNGQLNIGVVLYEDPSELGYGGSGGYGGGYGGYGGGTGSTGGFAGAFVGGSGPSGGSMP